MIIKNAKDEDQMNLAAGLPDVSEGVRMFLQKMNALIVTKEQIDGYTVEQEECKEVEAVRVPFSAQALAIKPEGQRQWRWHSLHCTPDLILKNDDIIVLKNVRYRIMEKYDFSEYGVLEYHMVEDYQDAETCN